MLLKSNIFVKIFNVFNSSSYGLRFGLIYITHLLLLMLLEPKLIKSDVPPHYWDAPYAMPFFDNTSQREVTTTVGKSAYLHCRVKNLGDRAVSWIRKRDLHILTVGIITYTNDQRFQSLHTEGSDEWTLRVSSPQPRDSATYECQVSTEPKISQGFRLNVVVSRAKILGNSELFIKSGSDLNLTCLALQSPTPPSFIYWYKDKRVMNYTKHGGINVITERKTRTSMLLIARATPADSGNYTCLPSSSYPASVVVHVINGEHPAAMQHGNSSANSLSNSLHSYRALKFINYYNFITKYKQLRFLLLNIWHIIQFKTLLTFIGFLLLNTTRNHRLTIATR